jgi:hypothetical protein
MMNSTDHQTESARLAAKVVGKVIRAAGTQVLIGAVAQELIDSWAAKNSFRARLARPVKWAVSKVFKPGGKGPQEGISGDVGSLITQLAKDANAGYAKSPAADGAKAGASIYEFLKNTDFGEIREMVEGSGPYVVKTVEAFNEQLWKYPAKVGTLAATVIPLVNTSMKVIREVLVPIEQAVGPDLLADILLSVVKGINGKEAARLVTSLQEALRRVHTGSLLLGKGGKPLFQIYLTDLLQDLLPGLDPVLLKKVRIALAEDREALANAMADALSSNPGIALASLSTLGQVKSSDFRIRTKRLGVMDSVDEESLKSAVSDGMSDFDTYEAANFVNTLCRLANRIHSARPDIVSSLVSGVTDSVNLDEVRETARWLIPDFVEAVRPIAEEVMPMLMESLSLLTSREGGHANPGLARAMNPLGESQAAGGEV